MTNFLNFDSNQNYINYPKICDINLNLNDCNIDIKNDNYSSIIPDNYLNIIYNAQEPFLISQEYNYILNFDSIIFNNTHQNSEMQNDKKNIIDKITKENIQKEIKEKIYLKKPFKEKKKLGRKIKSYECLGEHNKFSDDNIQMKLKNAILNSVFQFINQKLKILYSDNDKKFLNNMKLLKLKQNSKELSKVEYNKKLLRRTLKSIFSEEVSEKYSRYSPEHNKDLIETLINEKDEIKRIFFNKLFNLTFIDCLNHFRGSHFFEELCGMKKFEQYFNELKYGNNNDLYEKVLKYYLVNYEREVMDKKGRNRFKRK